jgi:hypothetical protein
MKEDKEKQNKEAQINMKKGSKGKDKEGERKEQWKEE